jgi:hypothetical protein
MSHEFVGKPQGLPPFISPGLGGCPILWRLHAGFGHLN